MTNTGKGSDFGKVLPAGVRVEGGTARILLGSNFWLQWTEIVIEHLSEAKKYRDQELEIDPTIPDPGNLFAVTLGREMRASMVAISASAHAIDAWYGVVKDVTPQPSLPPGTARSSWILATLKNGFQIGTLDRVWAKDFKWLFGIRDVAVHFKQEMRETELHPSGTHTAPENVIYSLEGAQRAAGLLRDVLKTCRVKAKPAHRALVTEVNGYAFAIDDLVSRLDEALS